MSQLKHKMINWMNIMIFLALDAHEKNILCYPCSARELHTGRNACTHITILLFFIRRTQRCDFNQDHFENSLPDNPIKLQNCITLIEHVGSADECKKAKKINMKQQ